MTNIIFPARNSRRSDKPSKSGSRRVVNPYGSDHAAKAARGAVYMAFGGHARALGQADFQDRKPWEVPTRAPGAWAR